MKYSEYRKTAQPGDIILCSGRTWLSWLIRVGSCSSWSHCGVVDLFNGAVRVWESTPRPVDIDNISGDWQSGVQEHYLSRYIRRYDGGVYVRRLREPLGGEQKAAMREVLRSLHGRPYEERKWSMACDRLGIRFVSDMKEDLSSIFCSELVAEAHQATGFLSEDYPSDNYWPCDFDGPDCDWLQRDVEILV